MKAQAVPTRPTVKVKPNGSTIAKDASPAAEPTAALSARIDRLAAAVEPIAELSARVDRLSSEVATLRQRLETIITFERFRDVVLTRYVTHPYRLPASSRLEARDFIESVEGIHFLEYDSSGTAFRWTGPGHFTRFTFFVDRSLPTRVHLVLLLLGQLSDHDTLSADIDGVVYPFSRTEQAGEFVAGPVPPRAGDAQTDVLLHVPVLFSPASGGDTRRLGVAIVSIALEPAT